MGKKGDALRAAKAQVKVLYSHEQIEAIKEKAAREAVERAKDRLIKEAWEFLDNEFEERMSILKGDTTEDTTLQLLTLLMAVPVTVLCRPKRDRNGKETGFGWAGLTGYQDDRKKIARFVDLLEDEINYLFMDETADVRNYAKACYENYGIMFKRGDTDEQQPVQ